MKKLTLIFILLLFAILNSNAQNQNMIVYYTSNSDLSDNSILSISIDSNGDKWIGTYDGGLVKFDDSIWTIYNSSNSGLPGNIVLSIFINTDNEKWIGTRDDGLAIFDNSNWTVYNTSNSGLPSNIVTSLIKDINGNKWIGTYGGGVAKFDGSNWTVYNTSNSGLPNNNISNIVEYLNGNLWIGTYYSGLVKFDGSNWTVYNTSNSGLPHNIVIAIAIDANGNKWLGTYGGGAAMFDGSNWTVYNTSNSGLPDNRIMSIEIDANGDKWFGTYGGIAKFDGTYWTVYDMFNSDLPHNDVSVITLSTNGDVWIGTGSGLAVIKAQRDIGVENISIPNDSVCGTENHVLNVTLKNHGNIWLSDIELTALISGDLTDTITAIYTDTIYPGASRSFNMGTFNTSQGGDVEIIAYSSLSDDADRSNDTLISQIHFYTSAPFPDVQSDSLCLEGSVLLSGTNTNNLTRWYLSDTTTIEESINASFMTENIDTTTYYYVENFTEKGCPSERKEIIVTVNSKPKASAIEQGSFFEGNWNTGTLQEPDELCAGMTISYELAPPDGYFNSEYGDKWGVSVELKTFDGFSAFNVVFSDPTVNENALVTFYSSASDADSTYMLSVIYLLYPSQCSDTAYRYIHVNPLPKASFTVNNQCVNSITSFNNTSTITYGNIIGYEWDFGDGNTSVFLGPEHTYDNTGIFSVKLKVTSDALCEDEINVDIDIYELPKPDFEISSQCALDTIRFINLTTYSEGNETLNYEWDFGINNETSTDFEPEYTFIAGTYTVNFKAISPEGCANSISKNVEIYELPVAEFTHTESMGKATFFPNNTSFVTYEWNFGDGNNSTDITPEHEYAENGSYEVSLKVEDENGCVNEEVIMIDLTSVSLELSENSKSLNLKNYPNPFTNETVISYELYENTEVSIVLLDLTGRKLADIDKGSKTAGTHTVILNSSEAGIADGMYMLYMQAGSEIVVRKIVKW